MFLDILELGMENNKKFLGKTFLKMWPQKFSKKLCFVPVIRQRLGNLLYLLVLVVFKILHVFLKVVLWTHQHIFDKYETKGTAETLFNRISSGWI